MPRQRLRPGYEDDRVGPIARYDERDNVFARHDLFRFFAEGSPEREQYYREHPELREYDECIAGQQRLGGRGGAYTSVGWGIFDACCSVAADEFVDGEPAPERRALPPEEATRRVKDYAGRLGADLVGTGPLRQEWVHSHVGRSFGNADGHEPRGTIVDLEHHTDAVALGFGMDLDFMKAAPEYPTYLATAYAYAVGAEVSIKLARYIRGLGYSARAHHVYNYRVLVVPVAVDCGLGELSRAGFLITREFGLGVRLGVVTTDLPLAHDGPVDIGVQSFCEQCEICAENCPSDAIPSGGKTVSNGIVKWKLDAERCYRYWYAVGTDCSVCMSTCPWTKPPTWLHRGLTALAAVKGPHQSLMVAAEKLFYGRPDRRDRGRSIGLESLRPTRVRAHMRVLGWVVGLLATLGVWRGVAGAPSATAAGLVGYLIWLVWTLLGLAAVWTFLAERTVRPAVVALILFGAVSAGIAVLLASVGTMP